MKSRTVDIAVFSLSLVAFIVSLGLLMRYGAYEIEYGGGAVVIDGGWPMIIMNMIRLVVLLALCVISGVRLYRGSKQPS